jgi:sporulation protein YlmC with PRC-barrel domain
MPYVNKKILFNLPVETASGVALGKVYDVEIDAEQHTVQAYLVRRQLLSNPLNADAHTLRIHPHQVQTVTEKKMIVDDATVPGGLPDRQAGAEATAPASPPATG